MSSILSITENVDEYLKNPAATARHRSFDYCFNRFQSWHDQDGLDAVLEPPQLQIACLHLGFYLASWGMYRGSSHLLKHSVLALAPVVEVIATAPREIWTSDVTDYDAETRDLILDVAKRLRAAFPGTASDTLVSKTMLGTFGCVPAFDSFLRRGAGIHSLGQKSLRWLGCFAEDHADEIQRNRHATLDFETGLETGRRFTAAKVIDMVFFIEGGGAEAL